MTVDVEVLIHDHKKAITTEDGIEFHTVPSLLSQLRDAVFGGMESTGGSALGSKLPISAGALDLYMLIDRQITEAWVGVFGRAPGAEKPERLLAEWAAHAQPDAIVTVAGREHYAETLVGDWVKRVEDFFNPPRLAEIAADCIACGERYVFSRVDGQDVRSSALRFHRDRDTNETLGVRCMACDATWTPAQFEYFASSIGIDVEAKKQAFREQEMSEAKRRIEP